VCEVPPPLSQVMKVPNLPEAGPKWQAEKGGGEGMTLRKEEQVGSTDFRMGVSRVSEMEGI
jgi:hypothetical protein